MRRRGWVTSFAVVNACGLAIGCSSEAPPLPQIIVVVDTDAPVVSQLLNDPTLSADAPIDTVRVDAIDAAGNAFDLRDFVVPDPGDWPLSFGVAAPPSGGRVRLRIRGFRGKLAIPGELRNVATLEPPAGVTIDRILDLTAPTDGIRAVRVLLAADCRGVVPSFLEPAKTCIDDAHRSASPSEGTTNLFDDLQPTVVGTWPGAREVRCMSTPPADRQCIRGGFEILGDPEFVGLEIDSVPLHAVRLSPFQLDTNEFTIARFLAYASKLTTPLPRTANPAAGDDAFCTFTGLKQSIGLDLPLNCVPWATAEELCELSGGKLPTEAQWDFAARGRGQGRRFPWGDADNDCCVSSTSRKGEANVPVECAGAGIENVGSHPISAACHEGLGDVSRDGVEDFAGSVAEVLLDNFGLYSEACWALSGVTLDPHCEVDGSTLHPARGGFWNSGLATGLASLRNAADPLGNPAEGFRCAYPDVSQ